MTGVALLRVAPTITVIAILAGACQAEKAAPAIAGTPVITFGASFPLTGDRASYGSDARNGIDLAISEINTAAKGRYRVGVIYENDLADGTIGVSNMEALAGTSHVPLVLGSACSNVTMAMAPVANRTKTVLLSPISSAPQLTNAGPYVFRTCPSDSQQAVVVSDWLKSHGVSRVGMLYVNNSWGLGLCDAFKKAFEEQHGVITDIESSDESDVDFRRSLTKLKASKPDALYLPTSGKQGGRILVELRDLGIRLPVFGAATWESPELLQTAGDAAEGAFFVAPEEYDGAEYQTFAAAYRRRYAKEPDFNASSSYDAAHIASLAVEKLLAAGQPVSGENLARALSTVEFRGATGLTRFDENGDVHKPFGKRVYRNGVASPLDP